MIICMDSPAQILKTIYHGDTTNWLALGGKNQEKGVKMLSINGVTPSLENIESGTYPLVTNVCLITRKNDANPYIQKMTDFILSEDGQKIIRETGYADIGN